MKMPVLSTGMAYHLPTEVHISHPPSNNFDFLHCRLLEFDSRQACRGVSVGIRKGKESGQREQSVADMLCCALGSMALPSTVT